MSRYRRRPIRRARNSAVAGIAQLAIYAFIIGAVIHFFAHL